MENVVVSPRNASASVKAVRTLRETAASMVSMLPPFWSLPTSFLSGAAAAGGIALINSVANIGGILGPITLGLIGDMTGSHTWGMLALAGTLSLGGILALFAPHDPTLNAWQRT